MRNPPRWLLVLSLLAIVGHAGMTAYACVHAPATLSPAGQQAFNNTRVIHGLDLLRDTAIAANAQNPPVLSTATTRKIVTYHESALKEINALGSGWKAAVSTGLDEAAKDLPIKESMLLAPYFSLVKALLAEIP